VISSRVFRAQGVVVIVLSLIAAVVWSAVGYRLSHSQEAIYYSTEPGFLTTNRDHLAICVDSTVADVGNEELREAVFAALERVKEHPSFIPAGLSQGTSEVTIGCPGPARATQPDFNWELGGNGETQVPWVEVPSEYRTFVYVVSEEHLWDESSGRVAHRAPQEYYYDGQVGAEVTSAVYLSSGDVQDSEAIVRYLTRGFGLTSSEAEGETR